MNGYCRIYNKQLELLEDQNIVVDHELTRIEIVYKPEKRIPLAELLHHPPQQNKQYFAAVVTDWDSLPKMRAKQARQLRDRVEIEKKKDWYTRKVVKETHVPSSQVDFNGLAKKFLSELDGKCALAFWHKYPSPYLLKGETVETLAHFLRLTSNNTCSTRKAEQLLEWIQADGDTTRKYQEQRDFLIRSHVRDIRFNKKEIARVEGELNRLMQQLDLQLETMRGIDLVTSSVLVAEIGDIHRFASADKLARFSGIAPVKIGSGGKHVNLKSRQGNRVLHGLFYNLAVQQVQVSKGSKKPRNPLFYEYFNRKKEEGKTPTQALVCVMRRLVNIIYGMMKHKTAFRLPEQTEKDAC